MVGDRRHQPRSYPPTQLPSPTGFFDCPGNEPSMVILVIAPRGAAVARQTDSSPPNLKPPRAELVSPGCFRWRAKAPRLATLQVAGLSEARGFQAVSMKTSLRSGFL